MKEQINVSYEESVVGKLPKSFTCDFLNKHDDKIVQFVEQCEAKDMLTKDAAAKLATYLQKLS